MIATTSSNSVCALALRRQAQRLLDRTYSTHYQVTCVPVLAAIQWTQSFLETIRSMLVVVHNMLILELQELSLQVQPRKYARV